MNATHVLQIQNFFFPDATLNSQIQESYDNTEIVVEVPQFEKKEQYQPATIIYAKTLIFIFFMQRKQYNYAELLGNQLISMIESYNKWNLDHLWGYIFYNYARVGEKLGKQAEIRPKLFSLYKLSSNNQNESSQAVLLNLILRNFIYTNNFMSAKDFINNTLFPESKQNNEFIKYLYYTAKIKATQQEYIDAYARVAQSLRKAPEKGVLGFKLAAQKLAIVTEMLMGDIPSRTIFSTGPLKPFLFPYYEQVNSLVKGNISQFENVRNKHHDIFKKDGLIILINRLYQNVIRAGLKKINSSYNQISFDDVKVKQGLAGSSDNMNWMLSGKDIDIGLVIAKALKDKVITGEINSEARILIIKDNKDIYSTSEPQINCQKRINYCLNIHDAAVKALQYPTENKHKTNTDNDNIEQLLFDFDEDLFF